MPIPSFSRASFWVATTQADTPAQPTSPPPLRSTLTAARQCSETPQPPQTDRSRIRQAVGLFTSCLRAFGDSVASFCTKKKFFLQLDWWARLGEWDEERKLAAIKIKEAYRESHPVLDLSRLNLESLPDLSPLTAVRDLNLSDNYFSSLERIARLTQLERLVLTNSMNTCKASRNKLLLPLAKLTQLQDLQLSHNRIVNGSSLQSLSKLTQLTKLHLACCGISDVTPLLQLSGLQDLDLYGNPLCDADQLRGLSSLKKLDLDGCRLHDLEWLSALPNLEVRQDPMHAFPLTWCGEPYGLLLKAKTSGPLFFARQGTEMLKSMMKYAQENIKAAGGWGNSSIINQLLIIADENPHLQPHGAALRAAYLQGLGLMDDQHQYLGFAKEAQDVLGLDMQKDLLFVTPDGQHALSMTASCYQKNILGQTGIEEPNAEFMTGTALHGQAHLDDPQLLGQGGASIEDQLELFPMLQQAYRSQQKLASLSAMLDELHLQEYAPRFKSALQQASLGKGAALVDESRQRELCALFADAMQYSPEDTISAEKIDAILTSVGYQRRSHPERMQALFCLAAIFARFSSSSMFGTEYDSLHALRRQAIALLNTAVQQDQESKSVALLHGETMQSILDKLKGNFCSNSTSTNMIVYANKYMPKQYDKLIPLAWR